MGITPHIRISTKHQKCRGYSPWGCITIINKREGGTLYKKTLNTWLIIPRPLRTVGKQLSPTGVTPTIILWVLYAQDSTHDHCNTKQMKKKRILIGKTDLDAAYLRIHANAKNASTCIAIVDEIAFLCLRLNFGTTPAPAEYTTVSEAKTDLGNNLLQDQSWDT